MKVEEHQHQTLFHHFVLFLSRAAVYTEEKQWVIKQKSPRLRAILINGQRLRLRAPLPTFYRSNICAGGIKLMDSKREGASH